MWSIVRLSSGATEIVPCTWVEGTSSFDPLTSWKTEMDSMQPSRVRSSLDKDGKQISKPGFSRFVVSVITFTEHTRLSIFLLNLTWPHCYSMLAETYNQAKLSLQRYLEEECDNTDIQSEEEGLAAWKEKEGNNKYPICNFTHHSILQKLGQKQTQCWCLCMYTGVFIAMGNLRRLFRRYSTVYSNLLVLFTSWPNPYDPEPRVSCLKQIHSSLYAGSPTDVLKLMHC